MLMLVSVLAKVDLWPPLSLAFTLLANNDVLLGLITLQHEVVQDQSFLKDCTHIAKNLTQDQCTSAD